MRTLLLPFLLVCTPVYAQTACAPRAQVQEQLLQQFQESRTNLGLSQGGTSVIELFQDQSNNTWTLVLTTPNGVSCLIAAGTDWVSVPTPKPIAGLNH